MYVQEFLAQSASKFADKYDREHKGSFCIWILNSKNATEEYILQIQKQNIYMNCKWALSKIFLGMLTNLPKYSM